MNVSDSGLRARCVELECLLQAKSAFISHLEAEKDTQARSHAERLAELQESCHRKVQQLQHSHRQQLAAAQASAAEALTAAAAPAASAVVAEEIAKLTKSLQAEQANSTAEIDTLQTRLLSSDEQQQLLQAQLDRSSHSSQALQLQVQRLQQDVATATAAASGAEEALHALQAQCSKQQDKIAQLQHGTANEMQQKSAAMLQLLEQQLVSLSGQIKQRDQQLAALRLTVQQQCDERILMQMQLVQLRRAAGSAEGESTNFASVSKEQQPSIATPGASTSTDRLNDSNTTGITCHKGETGDTSVQSRSNQARLNRIASASEQSAGKTGLLARILSTDSTTGKACR